MKQIVLFLVAVCLGVVAWAQNVSEQQFYVGTFTSEGAEGIYLCSFNTEDGSIKLKNTFRGVDNPSFLKLSRSREHLYVVSRTTEAVEKTGGFAIAYKVDRNGELKLLNKQPANGNGPCHVDVSPDEKYIAIATYGGGTTSLYPLSKNGFLKPAATIIKNQGTGGDPKRQDKPHAHSIKFSPFGKQVFSADLGTDQLNIYNLKNGGLEPAKQAFVKLPSASGPRHFVFHPTQEAIYVINELNSTISVIKKADCSWKVVQNISTLPENYMGESYCADIHFSKDGKFLYGSNRGHNSIAVFQVNADNQELEMKGCVSVEGNWPRNFSLSPNGKWMLVGNQKSNDITVFRINAETRMPEFTGKKFNLPSPVCIEFLSE